MFPTVGELLGVRLGLPTHEVFVALGVLAAAAVSVVEARRRGHTGERLLWVVTGALVGGGVMMRLGTWLQHVRLRDNAGLAEQWVLGNRSVLGGLVGAWPGVHVAKRLVAQLPPSAQQALNPYGQSTVNPYGAPPVNPYGAPQRPRLQWLLVVVGIPLGFVAWVVGSFAVLAVSGTLASSTGAGSAVALAVLVLGFLAAVGLAVWPRTRRLGQGFVLGAAIGLIVAGGLCIPLVSTF